MTPQHAILLVNLGSPASANTADVRRYLNEFLMDGKVIDIPVALRYPLVKGIIVPFRSPKSAAKYKKIWTPQGSPLLVISREVQRKLAGHTGLPVELCMRYASPDPGEALQRLQSQYPHLEEVVMVPLYPHYAMSSYETAVEHVQEFHHRGGYHFRLRTVAPFYQDARYIKVLADSIRPYLGHGQHHLLFSYHGIPERHLKKHACTKNYCLSRPDCCDEPSEAHAYCYRHQVITTTRRVAAALQLPDGSWSWSFQSRLGRDKWLRPYTTSVLKDYPAKGIKDLVVVCPAFVSDCLETLEEIHMEGREDFMHAGGNSYQVVPCLNDRDEWIETLALLAEEAFQKSHAHVPAG
jgi:ferrochelatase